MFQNKMRIKYQKQLEEINTKYYNKIKETYGCYIKNFDNIPDIMRNVYIIPDKNV